MPRTDAWSLLNLLPNFELIAGRKDGNGMTTPYLQRLDNTTVTMPCSEVYDGFNSAYIANASTATVYPGVYFLNVHVKKNTDYVVGVWLKGEKGNVVVLEVCRQSAVESRPGTGRASDAQSINYVTIEKDNEWEYHEMTVNSGAYELIEVNYWIGTNGQSAYIAKPSLQESRKGDKGDPGKQGEQGKSATSYRLQLKSGTEAKVVTNGSGDDVKFTLSAIIYYLVIKNTGGSDTEVTDAKFVATIEGKDRTVLYDTKTNKGYYLEYTGTTAYTATNTPQSAIPLTVTLADGTVLNDSIPVTIQPGVAVDIDNRLNQLTTTVADKADISTLEQTAGRISAKVADLGLRNLLMDSEFRCPVEKTIKRGGKKYREAWNNGASVTVTDTANGISAEGINAVKSVSAVTNGDWTVTRWYVPARQGQTYTASAWCMVPDTGTLTIDSRIILELYACKDDLTRDNSYVAVSAFDSPSPGTWARTAATLTMPDDTAHPYIEVALTAYKCGTVYFRQPQLELGSEATEWTRCADDVEGGLLATGIDIYNNKIELTSDNVEVKNNSGNTTMLLDKNGKLNVGLLDADKVQAGKISTTASSTDDKSHIDLFGNTGVVYQKNGKKGIELVFDDAGVPHIYFYNEDGVGTYDMGPNGVQSLLQGLKAAYIDSKLYIQISDTNSEMTNTDFKTAFLSGTKVYVGIYHAAHSGDTLTGTSKDADGKYITGYSSVDAKGNNGNLEEAGKYANGKFVCPINISYIENIVEGDYSDSEEGWKYSAYDPIADEWYEAPTDEGSVADGIDGTATTTIEYISLSSGVRQNSEDMVVSLKVNYTITYKFYHSAYNNEGTYPMSATFTIKEVTVLNKDGSEATGSAPVYKSAY